MRKRLSRLFVSLTALAAAASMYFYPGVARAIDPCPPDSLFCSNVCTAMSCDRGCTTLQACYENHPGCPGYLYGVLCGP